MCLNINFVPMFYDSYEDKKYLEFRLSLDTLPNLTYNDMCKLTFDFKHYTLKSAYASSIDLRDKTFLKYVPIPCGKCPQCMNNRAKEIMFRIMQETKEHKSNYFLTFTYDDEHLPPNYSLIKDEISKFNKKLKIYLSRSNKKSDFRFYGVGEYGGSTARPHYHVIYFGLELNDLEFYKVTDEGNILYTSKFIESVWSKGFVTIGEVTPNSAAYVARYTEKKKLLTKEEKQEFLDLGFVPEFSVQSMRPGIGYNFYKKSVVSFLNKCYTFSEKDTNFLLPKYYRDKIKNDSSIDEEALLNYESYLSQLFSSSFSGKVLYFGDKKTKIERNEIIDILRRKKSRSSL